MLQLEQLEIRDCPSGPANAVLIKTDGNAQLWECTGSVPNLPGMTFIASMPATNGAVDAWFVGPDPTLQPVVTTPAVKAPPVNAHLVSAKVQQFLVAGPGNLVDTVVTQVWEYTTVGHLAIQVVDGQLLAGILSLDADPEDLTPGVGWRWEAWHPVAVGPVQPDGTELATLDVVYQMASVGI